MRIFLKYFDIRGYLEIFSTFQFYHSYCGTEKIKIHQIFSYLVKKYILTESIFEIIVRKVLLDVVVHSSKKKSLQSQNFFWFNIYSHTVFIKNYAKQKCVIWAMKKNKYITMLHMLTWWTAYMGKKVKICFFYGPFFLSLTSLILFILWLSFTFSDTCIAESSSRTSQDMP